MPYWLNNLTPDLREAHLMSKPHRYPVPAKGTILVKTTDQLTFRETAMIHRLSGTDLFEASVTERERLLVWFSALRQDPVTYRGLKPADVDDWPRSVAGDWPGDDDEDDVREAAADIAGGVDDEEGGYDPADADGPPFTGPSEPAPGS